MNANSQTATPGKILLIDDEPAILITVKKILRAAGYDVETAQTGREGLGLFRQIPFDLVIVDRAMPEMNGEDVATEIKRLAPAFPIIMITGLPGSVTRHELFKAILGKPFRSPELLQSVTMAIVRKNDDRDADSTSSEGTNRPVNPSGGGFAGSPESAGWTNVVDYPCMGPA